MTYPSPPGDWKDPAWSAQSSPPPVDPTLQAGEPPTSGQPYGTDPPASGHPVAENPYAAPGQYGAGQYGAPGPYDASGQPGYADPYAPAGQVAAGYPAPGFPAAGYPAYGYPAPAPTNGMAIGSMVVSIIGAVGLCAYGLGGYLGIVGAILGHIARKQIRERGENGGGMATAGIVVGWIATVIAVIATILIVIFFVWAVNQETPSETGTGVTY
jgi:hypothetical protein